MSIDGGVWYGRRAAALATGLHGSLRTRARACARACACALLALGVLGVLCGEVLKVGGREAASHCVHGRLTDPPLTVSLSLRTSAGEGEKRGGGE